MGRENDVIMRKILVSIIFIVAVSLPTIGNDVRIRGEAKVQALTESTALITFPLSWDHSWRESESWDAVYLFVKYRRVGVNEPWHHAYLKDSGHRATGGNNVPAMEFLPVKTVNWNVLRLDTIYAGNYYPTSITSEPAVAGVFLFRRIPGNGNIDIPRVSLEWDFKQGDLNLYHDVTVDDIRNHKIEVSVQAVEMVYVPNGPYYLGDRISGYSFVSKENDSAFYMDTDDSVKVYIMGTTGTTGVQSAWVVPDLYPTGYTGYYTMKYEVSQEQYVNFLNRLTYADQKKRIGNDLDALATGDYAFGKKDQPSYRNGIILQDRFSTHDSAVVFGFDLNYDDPVNSDDDGKSIPCNYLTPDDMQAYCDWAGLRPNSEMEYEKACRQRNPSVVANARSFAWGNTKFASLDYWTPSTVKYDNSEEETVLINNQTETGRMNGPKVHNLGPVRCGAFATETSDIYKAGASRWGVMELTGNLAEIYYNSRQGKNFNGEVFGDGNIWSSVASWRTDTTVHVYQVFDVGCGTHTLITYKDLPMRTINKKGHRMLTRVRQSRVVTCGDCWNGCHYVIDEDVTVPWPVLEWPGEKENFMLRGGSFATDAIGQVTTIPVADYMAVSYRGDTVYAKALPEELRYSYTGFRGGRSVPMKSMLTGVIAAENGRSLDTAVVCAAGTYTIREIEAGDDMHDATIFVWEMNDEEQGWVAVDNSNTPDLELTGMPLMTEKLLHTYKFRRLSIASHAQSYGNEVTLVVPGCVINGGLNDMEISPYVSFIELTTELGAPGSVIVEWKLKGSTGGWNLLGNNTSTVKDVLKIDRTDLSPTIPLNDGGAVTVRVTVNINGCEIKKELALAVRVADVPCPATVTDRNNSNVYTVSLLKDGHCWMTQDLRTTVGGMMNSQYSWQQIQANGDNLCPPGFAIPTQQIWDLLWNSYYVTGETCDLTTQDYVSASDSCDFWGQYMLGNGLYQGAVAGFMTAMNVPLTDGYMLVDWWTNGPNNYFVTIDYDSSDPAACGSYFGQTNSDSEKHAIRCYRK